MWLQKRPSHHFCQSKRRSLAHPCFYTIPFHTGDAHRRNNTGLQPKSAEGTIIKNVFPVINTIIKHRGHTVRERFLHFLHTVAAGCVQRSRRKHHLEGWIRLHQRLLALTHASYAVASWLPSSVCHHSHLFLRWENLDVASFKLLQPLIRHTHVHARRV